MGQADKMTARRGRFRALLSVVIFCSPFKTYLGNRNIHACSVSAFISFTAMSQTCIMQDTEH